MMSDRIMAWVVYNPWAFAFFSIFLVLFATAGLFNYQSSNDPRQFFAADDPEFLRFTLLEKQFTSSEVVYFIVAPKDGNVFTQQHLAVTEALTREAWSLPKTLRVDSLTNFQFNQVAGDDLTVRNLVENADALSPAEVARIRDIALHETALLNNLISSRGHVAGVSVTVNMDNGAADAPAITRAAMALRDHYRSLYPDIDFMLSGSVVFSDAISQATDDAIFFTGSLVFGAAVLGLLFVFRSIKATFVTLLVIAFSISGAMGLAAWCGIVFSPTASMAPAIILTLAVADCVHLLLYYANACSKGQNREDAMFETMRLNSKPVFLTSITTAVGFLFMNTSESPPFRDLGNIVFFGVTLAWMLAVLFLPAATLLLPGRISAKEESIRSYVLMEKFGNHIVKHYKRFLVLSSIALVLSMSFMVKNEFNDTWFEYFDERYEVRRANDFMMKEITGMYRVEFAVPGAGENAIMDPAYLRKIDAFAQWAKQQPGVIWVASFADIIKRLNRDMHGGDAAYYTIPDDRELIAQYVLMFEMSLPFGLGLDNQIDMHRSTTRVRTVMSNTTSNGIIQFEQNAGHYIEQQFPPAMRTRGTGLDLLFGDIARQNVNSMVSGTLYTLLSVAAILLFGLGSRRYAVLSILPNLLPAAASFGLWGLLVGKVGLAVSVVACMTFGIVVDNTIHFLTKYAHYRRVAGMTAAQACRATFNVVGVPLVATTLILGVNFGVMATSSFQPNACMGILAAITLVMALLVTLFFFVPLLIVIDRKPATAPLPAEGEAVFPAYGNVPV